MGYVQIAILEPQKIGQDSLSNFYDGIFSALGYESKIIFINDSDEYSELELGKIDVFISDLSLGKSETYDGLIVIQKIKKSNPSLLVIAQSMTNVTFATASQYIPSFDVFVYKTKISDSLYKEYIVSLIREKFQRNIHLENICCDIKNSNIFKGEIGKNKLTNILKTILFTSHNIDKFTSVSKVNLEPMLGGYSESEVFRLEAYTAAGLKCINAILKVSPKKNYLEEKENYLKYVKWYLPYTWRPELIGYTETKDEGALCYSFAYNDEVPFSSLTECLENNNIEKLSLAIDGIFAPDYQRWYHKSNLQEGDDLTAYYYLKWFEGRDFSEDIFCNFIRKYGEVFENSVLVEGVEYKKPSQNLLGSSQGKYSTCICHGDLNSNNVLISDNNLMTFIDFESTKRGHVFEDFVVIEVCVRMHMNLNISFKNQVNAENKVNEGKLYSGIGTDIGNVFQIIINLRSYAKKNAPNENFKNYHYAIALYCYRLLRIDDLKDWQLEQIMACLISNSKFVENAVKTG